MYICTITSNSSYGRTYEVETKSAMKAAAKLGRFEGGEVVTIRRKNGVIISRVIWVPECGGRYIRVEHPHSMD